MVKNGPKVCEGIPHCPRHLSKSTNFGRTSKRYWRAREIYKKKHIRTRTFVGAFFRQLFFFESQIFKRDEFQKAIGFSHSKSWGLASPPIPVGRLEYFCGALNPTKTGCQPSHKKETNIKTIKHLPKFPSISDHFLRFFQKS